MNVRELISLYVANIGARTLAGDLTPLVEANYIRDLADFAAQFGDMPIERCRQHDLTEFLARHPDWKAVNTKRSRVSSVLACFRWAADQELIPSCPYRSPRALRGLIAETRRPATREEFEGLMDVGSPALRNALLFLFLTGCRTCEMRELVWADVRLEGPEQPHLFLVKHKTVKRTGRARIVGLDLQCVELLRELRAVSKSDYVFLNCRGFPWKKDAFCHHVRRAARRVGLDEGVTERVSAYCLRHTYACDGIEAGFTEDQVAHQLGNSPEIVRRVYSRRLGQKIDFISRVANGIGKDRRKG